jgi:hypothetical protein
MTKGEMAGLFCFVLGWLNKLMSGHVATVEVGPVDIGEGFNVEFLLRGPLAQHFVAVRNVRTPYASPQVWVDGRLRYGEKADHLIDLASIWAATHAGVAPDTGRAFSLRHKFAKKRAKLPYDFG